VIYEFVAIDGAPYKAERSLFGLPWMSEEIQLPVACPSKGHANIPIPVEAKAAQPAVVAKFAAKPPH
jgi:hypothetical protein